MVSFRGKKKACATPTLVSFRGLIQNFRRVSLPLSYVEFPPGSQVRVFIHFIEGKLDLKLVSLRRSQ